MQIPSPLTEEMAAAKKEKLAEKKKAKKKAIKGRRMVRVVIKLEYKKPSNIHMYCVILQVSLLFVGATRRESGEPGY